MITNILSGNESSTNNSPDTHYISLRMSSETLYPLATSAPWEGAAMISSYSNNQHMGYYRVIIYHSSAKHLIALTYYCNKNHKNLPLAPASFPCIMIFRHCDKYCRKNNNKQLNKQHISIEY